MLRRDSDVAIAAEQRHERWPDDVRARQKLLRALRPSGG